MTCTCCRGACCNGTTCTIVSGPGACSGRWQGFGTACTTDLCSLGACCVGSTCSQLTEAQCRAAGGTFLGVGVACNSFSCYGRCCYETFFGTDECAWTDANNCSGNFYGPGTDCAGFDCGRGACCTNGVCTYVFSNQCSGTFRGKGSFCSADTCQATGACNTATQSGGAGVTINYFSMPVASGTVTFTYDAFQVPDAFKVEGGGQVLLDIPSTSGSGSRTFRKPTGVTVVKVTVTGPLSGTGWTYTIGCPNPLP